MSLPKGTLKQRVMRAGGWTAAGYGANQLIRFGSNLLMTRLLFPEAFGLMAIVQAVITGVTLLSDLGIGQSIVRHARGTEPSYMNTAWTIQILKGVLISLAICAVAFPVAAAYGQPLLGPLLLVAALAALIGGFNSTKIALASRNVDAMRVTAIDVGSLTLGILSSLAFALHDPSPWALVWGNVIGALAKMLASHYVLKGPLNRLAWDKEVAHSIFSFGAWVLLSSALTFLTGEGNRLILAALLDVRLLGLLGLAGTINLVLWQAVRQVSARVLFPAYAEVVRTDPKRLSGVVERARWMQVAPGWMLALVFALSGPQIIRFLYDPRYADAGIILQFQALSLMVTMLIGSYAGVLWAIDKMRLSTAMLAVQIVVQVAGMFVGAWLFGKGGVIIGFAAAAWLLYPVHAIVYWRLGLWHWRIDVPVVVASLLATTWVAATADWNAIRAWG
jgi:O-antigen/teichoic acid export membrane protein